MVSNFKKPLNSVPLGTIWKVSGVVRSRRVLPFLRKSFRKKNTKTPISPELRNQSYSYLRHSTSLLPNFFWWKNGYDSFSRLGDISVSKCDGRTAGRTEPQTKLRSGLVCSSFLKIRTGNHFFRCAVSEGITVTSLLRKLKIVKLRLNNHLNTCFRKVTILDLYS